MPMRKEKKDLRIVRTKKYLYEALMVLLKEKTFEEIKVSDICEEALVNRSTFYSHYNDKYDLLDAFIKDVKISLKEELEKNNNITNTKEYYLEMLRIFFQHVGMRESFYSSILLRLETENRNSQRIPSDIIASFYLGAVFNMGVEWLKYPSKYTTEELLLYLDKLLPESL